MFTILGRPAKNGGSFCDGVSRRGFLTVGGLLGGMTLARALEMEALAGIGSSHKAIINIYLPGGPSHLDMWDLKPDAPVEIRGEFMPIKTKVPGVEICELFPKIAAMMDKFVVVRSLSDSSGDHSAYQCMTGRKPGQREPRGGWPSVGAWISKAQGQANPATPPNLALMYTCGNRPWGEPFGPGFLGTAHNSFNLLGSKVREKNANMVLNGVTLERLKDRDQLRRAFDQFRRDADNRGLMDGLDAYGQQAVGILTSSKLAEALDLSLEDPRVLERYGKNDEQFQRDGAPRMVENFCVARRLVEAGARYVSMNYSRWDWHGGDGMNFPSSRIEFPMLDQALAALVTDLHERGLDRDVSIVLWGEFGRTPKINNMNSRDHWPQANACVLAGGGMRTGQVIGATNRLGEYPVQRPVKFQEVFATLYHNIGLDVKKVRVFDNSGTPQYLVDDGNEPLSELV